MPDKVMLSMKLTINAQNLSTYYVKRRCMPVWKKIDI